LSLPYKLGDTVQIIDENLEGVSGIVKNIDMKKEIVGVLVSMFGRETMVELQLEDVVPIN
jgi:transcriptional antiterminator NusG